MSWFVCEEVCVGLDAASISLPGYLANHAQARSRGGMFQQSTHVFDAHKLRGPQGTSQMAEQAVVDGVVFRAIGWKMADAECAAKSSAELVKLLPKQRHTVAVAAAAIGQQEDRSRDIVTPLAQPIPPAANRVTGQFTRVGTTGLNGPSDFRWLFSAGSAPRVTRVILHLW